MSVKVLNLDLLLVLIGVVEHNDLHGLLERLRIFKIYHEATLAEFILWFLSRLVELSVKLLEVSRWRSLGTLFGNLVSCTWGLDLEVDLLSLLLLALGLAKTFVPHVIVMLLLRLLASVLRLLTLQELFIILLCLLVSLDLSSRFSTGSFAALTGLLGLPSDILQYLLNHFLSLLLFSGGLTTSLGVQGLHYIGLGLLKCLLSSILLYLFSWLWLLWLHWCWSCSLWLRLCLWCGSWLLWLLLLLIGLSLRFISSRIRYSRFTGLFSLLGLRLRVIINWHFLLRLRLLLSSGLSSGIIGLGHFSGGSLCSLVIRLCLVIFRALHHFLLLGIFTLLGFDLGKFIIGCFLLLRLVIFAGMCGLLLLLIVRLAH